MARSFKHFIMMAFAFLLFFVSDLKANKIRSQINHLNFSLWSEYTKVDFDSLNQFEKTKKLEAIFQDKLQFIQTHSIRRLIVKILDPSLFAFFHPENFNEETPDNFFYWALKLSNHVEIEALFDSSTFQFIESSFFECLNEYYKYFKAYFHQNSPWFGSFQNIIEKMEWISIINEIYKSQDKKSPLISGITLNLLKTEHEDVIYQNLINAFDQFRFSAIAETAIPEWIPKNSFYPMRIGMILPVDKKDLALANIASFPLNKDLQLIDNPKEIGIHLPQNYPSKPPYYFPPSWRPCSHQEPLLNTVYLNLGDHRLIPITYQNYKVLPNPFISNTKSVNNLSNQLNRALKGVPFIKGPGYISCLKGCTEVKGIHTFFLTGSSKGKGKFVPGQFIEIRPPYLNAPTKKQIKKIHSNRDMELVSAFTTTKDLKNTEYFLSPLPVNWTTPAFSHALKSRIYFVFNTNYTPKEDQFLGNWSLRNFIQFLYNQKQKLGFLFDPLFTNLNNQKTLPHNNLVLYDFSCIPNGDPYPESNWNLGNQNH